MLRYQTPPPSQKLETPSGFSSPAYYASTLGFIVLAYEFGWPRVDFDMNPVAAGFAIFCAVLFVFLLGSIITISLFAEDRKRDAMYHSQWADNKEEDDFEDDDIEPFVPDSDPALPSVSASVAEMFGDAADVERMSAGAPSVSVNEPGARNVS